MGDDDDRLRASFANIRACDAHTAPDAEAMLAHARRHPAHVPRVRLRAVGLVVAVSAAAAAVLLVAIPLAQPASRPTAPPPVADLPAIEARCQSLHRAIADDAPASLFEWRPASRSWLL